MFRRRSRSLKLGRPTAARDAKWGRLYYAPERGRDSFLWRGDGPDGEDMWYSVSQVGADEVDVQGYERLQLVLRPGERS